jgi:hypothetical protein
MKAEFRQECEINGQRFGHKKHLEPGIHEVPVSFKEDWYFMALVNEGKIIILEDEIESIVEEKKIEVKKGKGITQPLVPIFLSLKAR